MKNLNYHTDLQLVCLYKQTKKQTYFSQLHHRLYPKVYQQCLSIVGRKETANEITASIFLHLSIIIPELGNEKIFFSYLIDKVNQDCTQALLLVRETKNIPLQRNYIVNSF